MKARTNPQDVAYPRCSAGRRACPPEDCGGPLDYERTLRAIRARTAALPRTARVGLPPIRPGPLRP
ncbi:hypothetical protein [Streptomyces sp. NPDC017260]